MVGRRISFSIPAEEKKFLKEKAEELGITAYKLNQSIIHNWYMEKKTNVRTETPAPGLEAGNEKAPGGNKQIHPGETKPDREDPFKWPGEPFPNFNRVPRPPWEE